MGEVGKQPLNITGNVNRVRVREIVRDQSVQDLGIGFGDWSLFEWVSIDHHSEHRHRPNEWFIIFLDRHIVNGQKVKVRESANKEVLSFFVVIRPQHGFKQHLRQLIVLNVDDDSIGFRKCPMGDGEFCQKYERTVQFLKSLT